MILLQKIRKILKRSLLAVLLLLVFLYIILQLPPVQTWIIKRVAGNLSEKLHTRVTIQHIDFSFFNKMELNGLLIEDQQKDSLLYAGTAQVNITDWFFLKKNATIKYLGLSDVTVKMKRTDSVWNYQFIVDYFSNPEKDTSKKSGIQFDIKQIELRNVQFNQQDGWVGKDMRIGVKKLDLSADKIDFTRKKFLINTLDLDEPIYSEYFYSGHRITPNNPVTTSGQITGTDTSKTVSNESWMINIKQLHLNEGTFASHRQSDIAGDSTIFDGENIRFYSITGDLKNVRLQADTLSSEFSLSAKERCGLEVKKIQARLRFTPQIMEFNDLDLITNKSRLRNYYAMHFNHFDDDMGDFLHKIDIDANFENSDVSSDDISFFTPALKNWKRRFNLIGIFKGKIDNFSARKMVIKSGNTTVDGDIVLNGLPDINNTFIDFKSNNLQTNFNDITSIIPSLKKIQQPQLSRLNSVQFKGNFTGFFKDFVTIGTINTNLGSLTANLTLQLPDNKPAVYFGNVSTNGFQLGQFLNTQGVGNIAFTGKINGSGFTPDVINTNFDGSIAELDFTWYTYRNINVKGDFKKRLFTGNLSIHDPNLKLDTLQGTIDLSGKEPQFDFKANLARANLKDLGLTNADFTLGGNFNLNFSGSNIDNFTGVAIVNHASLLHDGKPLSFDSLVLRSEIVNTEKILTLQSNEIEAKVNGRFKIMELPDAFKLFLNHYYPSYVQSPAYNVEDQDFSFRVNTKNVNDYFTIIDKKLSGFNNATLSGSLELKKNNLTIIATVPQFGYSGKEFNGVRLESTGNLDTLITKINADDIDINDSLHLPTSNLLLTSHDDMSDIRIKTSASKTLTGASINAQVQTIKNAVKIHFLSSSFIINDKEWDLEKDGELLLGNSQVTANNIRLSQGNQRINIQTVPSPIYPINDVLVNLSKLNISDVAPFVITTPKLEGLLNGSIRISNLLNTPDLNYDVKTDAFRLDNDSIGALAIKGNYSGETGIVKFNVLGDNTSSSLAINGTINTKDTSSNQTDISFIADKFNLNLLNNYLGAVFNNMKGTANTSDLHISGNSKHLYITGTAFINNASLRVNYTQCRYDFTNATILFNPDEINLGTITVRDSLNNKGTISGKLYHNFFQDFEFDNLHFSTKKMLVLNTTKKDNNEFYGKVIGEADMTLNGPVSNMRMNISGEPSKTDSSHIYLLSSNSIESNAIDYIDFIQFGEKMGEDYKGSKSSNILVDMNLSSNPACKIDVILDESTGDVIQGEGYCNQLNIRVGTNEPLSIRGHYDITKGQYTFNFEKFLKKPFTLTTGTITWSGDPYSANINIIAEYLANNVDFSSIPTISSYTTTARSKSDVMVIAHLTENLNNPKINFEFELPDYSSLKNDVVITKRLQEFENDENEMNKQVTSLLLFNSFLNNTQSFISASSGYSVLSGTIGGVISSTVSGFFNTLLQKYVKNTSFYFNSNSSYSSTDVEKNVNKLEAVVGSGVKFNLVNGRLIVAAGVNLDYNDPYLISLNNNNLFVTPDFTAQWLLTKDGKVRVVGFNKTSVDINGQRNSSGMKLSYQKDFDKLSELFNPEEEKKKNNKKPEELKDTTGSD